MSPRPRRGRGARDREAYQRQIAGSPETPTAPAAGAPFGLDSPDGTAAQTGRGERIPLRPVAPGRRPRRRAARWSWQTIWIAVGSIVGALALVGAAVWSVAWNAAGLKGLEEKHNTFATRVGEDFKRLEAYVDKRIGDLLQGDARRDAGPPPRKK